MLRSLARLARQLKRSGITQQDVAAACGVHHTMVCKVLRGAAVSAKVVATAERVILEKRLGQLARAAR